MAERLMVVGLGYSGVAVASAARRAGWDVLGTTRRAPGAGRGGFRRGRRGAGQRHPSANDRAAGRGGRSLPGRAWRRLAGGVALGRISVHHRRVWRSWRWLGGRGDGARAGSAAQLAAAGGGGELEGGGAGGVSRSMCSGSPASTARAAARWMICGRARRGGHIGLGTPSAASMSRTLRGLCWRRWRGHRRGRGCCICRMTSRRRAPWLWNTRPGCLACRRRRCATMRRPSRG